MTDLKALAEAATPGPWETRGQGVFSVAGYVAEIAGHAPAVAYLSTPRGAEQRDADAAYIAAASPDVILALIAERDALRKALKSAARFIEQLGDSDLDEKSAADGRIIVGMVFQEQARTVYGPRCRTALESRREEARI